MEKKRWRVHDSPKIFAAIILGCLALSLIGSTLAYYQQGDRLQNPFSVGTPEVAVKENYNPTDLWLPGEEKQKEVWFENKGEMDMLLRFHLEVSWQDKDGKPITPPPPMTAADAVTLNWDKADQNGIPDGWTKIGSDYYYNQILKAGAATDKTLKSVTFSDELSNDSHGYDYSNIRCVVTVVAETVLTDERAAEEEWNVRASISQPGTATGAETVTWSPVTNR